MATIINDTPRVQVVSTALIKSGGTVSSAIALEGCNNGIFATPAALTGSAITFQVSADGGLTFTALYDSSNSAVSRTVGTGRAYALPTELKGATHVKFVSGSAEGADRTILCSLSS